MATVIGYPVDYIVLVHVERNVGLQTWLPGFKPTYDGYRITLLIWFCFTNIVSSCNTRLFFIQKKHSRITAGIAVTCKGTLYSTRACVRRAVIWQGVRWEVLLMQPTRLQLLMAVAFDSQSSTRCIERSSGKFSAIGRYRRSFRPSTYLFHTCSRIKVENENLVGSLQGLLRSSATNWCAVIVRGLKQAQIRNILNK